MSNLLDSSSSSDEEDGLSSVTTGRYHLRTHSSSPYRRAASSLAAPNHKEIIRKPITSKQTNTNQGKGKPKIGRPPLPSVASVPAAPSEIECAICHQVIDTLEAEAILCGHVYHRSCIQKWLIGSRNTCPICRVVVRDIRVQSLSSSSSDSDAIEIMDTQPFIRAAVPAAVPAPSSLSHNSAPSMISHNTNDPDVMPPLPATSTFSHSANEPELRSSVYTPPVNDNMVAATGGHRTKNFSQAEIEYLFKLIQERKPLNEEAWKVVAREFCLKFTRSGKTYSSLRNKFNRLANTKARTGEAGPNNNVRRAIELREMLFHEHGGNDAESEDIFAHLVDGINDDDPPEDAADFEINQGLVADSPILPNTMRPQDESSNQSNFRMPSFTRQLSSIDAAPVGDGRRILVPPPIPGPFASGTSIPVAQNFDLTRRGTKTKSDVDQSSLMSSTMLSYVMYQQEQQNQQQLFMTQRYEAERRLRQEERDEARRRREEEREEARKIREEERAEREVERERREAEKDQRMMMFMAAMFGRRSEDDVSSKSGMKTPHE
jgi:hypothetical protein